MKKAHCGLIQVGTNTKMVKGTKCLGKKMIKMMVTDSIVLKVVGLQPLKISFFLSYLHRAKICVLTII